jgi:hypothetical protein
VTVPLSCSKPSLARHVRKGLVEVGKDRIAQHHLVLLVERRPGRQPSSGSGAQRLAVLSAQNFHDLVQQEPARAQMWRPKVVFPMLTTLLLRRALFMTHPCSTESASMQFPSRNSINGAMVEASRLQDVWLLMLEDGGRPRSGTTPSGGTRRGRRADSRPMTAMCVHPSPCQSVRRSDGRYREDACPAQECGRGG